MIFEEMEKTIFMFWGPGGRGWVLMIPIDAESNFQLNGID